MKKYLFIITSVLTIFFLVVGSLTNVVDAYVKNQKKIGENSQKKLLFQGKLTKILRFLKICSMAQEHRIQRETLDQVITSSKDNNSTAYKETLRSINPGCDCETRTKVLIWRFPVICMILFNFFVISALLNLQSLVESILALAQSLHCSWAPQPPNIFETS